MSEVIKKSKPLSATNVKAVFYDSQYMKNHASILRKLKKLYKNVKFEDFMADFIHCLKISFTHPETSPLVENSLNFAAKFSVSLSNNPSVEEDEISPFLNGILQFLFESHGCEDHKVRIRICHFLNLLLCSMGHDAFLSADVYSKIGTCMMERLQDKVAKVRAEAVNALYRLQDPSDTTCRIISVFLYHMKYDPSDIVRCAILRKIAVNKLTIPFILKRIHDIKDVVRRAAYKVLGKLTVQRFSIRQRQTILENGLNDKFAMVKNFIVGRILPAWLDAYNSNYIEFMQSISVESFTDVGIMALKELFKIQHIVPLASMGIEDKLISYSILTSERIVFWRALAEYLKPTDDITEESIKHFKNVLPDLTPFTQYIHQYFFPSKKGERENAPTEFVLVQLLLMTKIYDFSDEMGRLCLKVLYMDLLRSSRVGPNTTRVIAQLLSYVHPVQYTRVSFMEEIVSELREPPSPLNATFDESKSFPVQDAHSSKNDLETLIKCLTIITTVLEAEDITEMNPIFSSLLQNFILPMLDNETQNDERVNQLALQALGVFCILDLELAKEKFLIICFQIANESLCEISLKVIFDLLHFHGLDVFNIEEPTGDFTDNDVLNGNTRQRPNLISLLISLLNSQMSLLRNTVLQGLCKLIYAKRICNPYLLTHLFVLWFNPELEDDAQISQSLKIFFNMYATNCPGASSMILECFIPTVKAFSGIGYTDIVGKVDVNDVINRMVNLTRPSINKYDTKKNTHNLLAIMICKEILEFNEELNMSLLIKTLLNLDLNFHIQEDIETVVSYVQDIRKLLEKCRDTVNIKCILKLQLMLDVMQFEANHSVSTVQNTLQENKSMISSSTDTCHEQRSRFGLITEKEVDSHFENEDFSEETHSYESSPIRNIIGEEIVIPETSDSESEQSDLEINQLRMVRTPESADAR